jgi:hypothetical protein
MRTNTMKNLKRKFVWTTVLPGIATAAWLAPRTVRAEDFSNPSVASYWLESTYDSAGNEGVNAFGAPSVSGGELIGAIPTDTPTRPTSDGGGQGFEDVEHVAVSSGQAGAPAQYDGSLLGDISGQTGLTATFSLSDSGITSGAPFTASEFGGETGASVPGVRLYFKNGNFVDPASPEYGISEWWYTPNPALVTSMQDGVETTLTADFTNLAGWTDIDGHSASTEPAAFETALAGVTSLGLSLGSGNFYSDGFGFNTGSPTTADIAVDSINTTVPEPASLSLLALGIPVLLRRRRKA